MWRANGIVDPAFSCYVVRVKSRKRKGETAKDPKIPKAVARAREVRGKASEMTPEENERHFNLAMQMIYGEAAGSKPRG